MSHNHHHCECKHVNLAYCDTCKLVYCKDCNKEWVERTSWISYSGTPYTFEVTSNTDVYTSCNCAHS